MTLVHNFEGGVDGATIGLGGGSNSDTPGNNFFDDVLRDATGTPGVVQFSNVQKHSGSLAGRFQCGTVAGMTCVAWTTSRTAVTDDFCRAYFYLTTAYTINQPIFYWESSAFAGEGCVYLNAAGTISVGNASNAVIATSSATLALNTLHRIEAKHHADTATGNITVRLFLGANVDGLTPDDTINPVNFTGPSTQSGKFYAGMPLAAASQPPAGFLYMDDLADNAPDWLGPVAVPGPIIGIRSDVNRGFGPF